ncbi:hypothetical protein [Phenylobacterium sp.]|uniref:hypothetical protein n=1 Tax=Phenylobacterium sp. TaxID=1871053 RepID=UPI003BAC28CA
MLNPSQVWNREDLDRVSAATALLRSAQTLIGHDDGMARALLDDALVMLGGATGAFASPVHVHH